MKKIIIPIIMFLVFAFSVIAATVVNLDPEAILANATISSSASITHNFNVTGNQSIWACYLYSDEDGSSGAGNWTQKQVDSGVTNNTNTNFSIRQNVADSAGPVYDWDIKCNATTNRLGDWGASSNDTVSSGERQYGVDTTNPNISSLSPSSGAWQTNAAAIITIVVIDNNANNCTLTTTINKTGNTTYASMTVQTPEAYTNNTQLNFSGFDTGETNLSDNGTGAYRFNVSCDDDAGNIATASTRTFYVDTTAPSGGIDFDTSLWRTDNRALYNGTTATDYTPQVGWNETTELNFSRYEIDFCIIGGGCNQTNITTKATLSTNVSTLLADTSYQINITAFDLAGNSLAITTQSGYKYSTDSTNRALLAGWNIIGNVGNAFTLSEILNWTGATTTSIWNSTHQFKSHVTGGSFGTTSVTAGNTVLIFLSSSTTLSDLIWNTSAINVASHNITNQSASDWNLVMNRNSTDSKTFQDIDSYVNCVNLTAGCAAGLNTDANVTFFSAYNNSASSGSKYIPYVGNWSINNGTTLGFGNTVWLFLGDDATSTLTLDWTII